MRPAADAKGITLRVLGAPDVTLSADLVRLEQMLFSYPLNTVKFTPFGGSVTVTLTTDPDLPHVFRPFFRVDSLEGRTETGAELVWPSSSASPSLVVTASGPRVRPVTPPVRRSPRATVRP